jgi:hypothetical protein
VARFVALTPAEGIGTSVIVLAEIRRGIELKRRRDPEQAWSLERWFGEMRRRLGDRVLLVDEPIADAWAVLAIPNPLRLIDGLLAQRPRYTDLLSSRAMSIALSEPACRSLIPSRRGGRQTARGPSRQGGLVIMQVGACR